MRQWKRALVIAAIVFTPASAYSQPIARSYFSLEARIASAETVARGTIVKVSRKVITSVGDAFQPNGIIERRFPQHGNRLTF